MSEHLPAPSHHEKAPSVEATETRHHGERERSTEREHEPEQQAPDAESARKAVAEQAVSSTETVSAASEHANDQPGATYGVQRELKADAYRRTITHIQQQLPTPLRAFSKVVHNPKVEVVSTAAANTAARPSGILGGAIISLVGSAGLLYAAKHYGFTYNYALIFLLFAVGFLAGLAIELAVVGIRNRR